MDFNFMSQPQGPVIPVSLFADAASKGIASGNALPSTTSAIINGAIQGVQTGQQIYSNYQNSEIKQNQINQQPVQNARQQSELEMEQQQVIAAKQKNQINQLSTDVMMNNQQLVQDSTLNELKAKKRATDDALAEQDTSTSIDADLNSNNPNTRAGILNNPKYQSYLTRNPKLADSVISRLGANGDITPDQQAKYETANDYWKNRQYQEQKIQKEMEMRKQVLADQQKVNGEFSDQFSSYLKGLNTTDDVLQRLEVHPTGTKNVDATGKIGNPDIPDTSILEAQTKGLFVGEKPYTVYIDKKPVGYVSEEQNRIHSKWVRQQQITDGFIKDGVFGLGASGPLTGNTMPKPLAGQAISTKVNPVQTLASSASSGIPGGVAGEAQTPEVAAGNQDIVNLKRKEFDKFAASQGASGLNQGTIEQRVLDMKNRINRGLAAAKQDSLDAVLGPDWGPKPTVNSGNGAKPSVQGNAIVNQSAPNSEAATTASQAPTPEEGAQQMFAKPVSFTFDTNYPSSVSREAYAAVKAEPLLANESPIIQGMAVVESGGKRNATSETNVRGLLQVTKQTASIYGLNRDIPEENVQAGKNYLMDNLITFKGNLRLALTAYNAGPGIVADAVHRAGTYDWPEVVSALKDTLSSKKFKEATQYPDKVIAATARFLNPDDDSSKLLAGMMYRNKLISLV